MGVESVVCVCGGGGVFWGLAGICLRLSLTLVFNRKAQDVLNLLVRKGRFWDKTIVTY